MEWVGLREPQAQNSDMSVSVIPTRKEFPYAAVRRKQKGGLRVWLTCNIMNIPHLQLQPH